MAITGFFEPWATRQMQRANQPRAVGYNVPNSLVRVSGGAQPFKAGGDEKETKNPAPPSITLHALEVPYPVTDTVIYSGRIYGKNVKDTPENRLYADLGHTPLIDLGGATYTVQKNNGWEADDIEVTTTDPAIVKALLHYCHASVNGMEDLQPKPPVNGPDDVRHQDAELAANYYRWQPNLMIYIVDRYGSAAGYVSTIEFEGEYKADQPEQCVIRATGLQDWLFTLPVLAAGELIEWGNPLIRTAQCPTGNKEAFIAKQYNWHHLPVVDFIPLVKSGQAAGYTVVSGTQKDLVEKIIASTMKNLTRLAVAAPAKFGGTNVAPSRSETALKYTSFQRLQTGYIHWVEDSDFYPEQNSPFSIGYDSGGGYSVALTDDKTLGDVLREILGDSWRVDVLPDFYDNTFTIWFTQVGKQVV